MERALFLDRDGIFNRIILRDGQLTSPRHWIQVTQYEGLENLCFIQEMGYRLILVTNQPGVENRLLTEGYLESFHTYLKNRYHLDAVYYSPYRAADHPNRKPNPGMLLEASLKFGISLPDSFMLGDTESDTGAARNGGCRSILWDRPYNRHITSDHRVSSVYELHQLLAQALNEETDA